MDVVRMMLSVLACFLLMSSSPAWAVIVTEPSSGASYLFIVVAVLGGIISFMGIVLAFRGVKSPAEVSIKIPGLGTFTFKKVGQGVVVAIIGAITMISAIYLYPTKTTKTVTEATITEGEDGTRMIHTEQAN